MDPWNYCYFLLLRITSILKSWVNEEWNFTAFPGLFLQCFHHINTRSSGGATFPWQRENIWLHRQGHSHPWQVCGLLRRFSWSRSKLLSSVPGLLGTKTLCWKCLLVAKFLTSSEFHNNHHIILFRMIFLNAPTRPLRSHSLCPNSKVTGQG